MEERQQVRKDYGYDDTYFRFERFHWEVSSILVGFCAATSAKHGVRRTLFQGLHPEFTKFSDEILFFTGNQ